MQTPADEVSYLALLITGIAVILVSTAGMARMMGWGPNSIGDSGDIRAFGPMGTSEARAKARCAECGVIVSMREIERHDEDSAPPAAGGLMAGSGDEMRVKSTRSYEINVRMADGSRRVINDANPASWRTGERLIMIGGVKPSHR